MLLPPPLTFVHFDNPPAAHLYQRRLPRYCSSVATGLQVCCRQIFQKNAIPKDYVDGYVNTSTANNQGFFPIGKVIVQLYSADKNSAIDGYVFSTAPQTLSRLHQ